MRLHLRRGVCSMAGDVRQRWHLQQHCNTHDSASVQIWSEAGWVVRSVIGEVRQRWHLWQRNYELFLGKRQFAAVNSGLLAWEFVLRDEQGGAPS